MGILKTVAKIPLDIVAFFLKKSQAALYYLVNEPLRDDIQKISERAFAYQHIENAIHIAKKNALNTEGVILDVGGGTATTATLFSTHFPQNKIYIFEPIKANFEEIVRQKQKNWILVNKAVGSEVGTTHINIANRITASSLLEMNENTEGYGDMLVLKDKENISVTTLDTEIPSKLSILILKMDVQGFEMEVLKGASKTLSRTAIVVLEINNHEGYKGAPTYFDIDAFLRKKDFVLYDILPNVRIHNKLQDWDAIYIKEQKHRYA
jgi:FkbM family methyltransferase